MAHPLTGLQPLPCGCSLGSHRFAASATYGCSLCGSRLQARILAESKKNDPPGKMDEDILKKWSGMVIVSRAEVSKQSHSKQRHSK